MRAEAQLGRIDTQLAQVRASRQLVAAQVMATLVAVSDQVEVCELAYGDMVDAMHMLLVIPPEELAGPTASTFFSRVHERGDTARAALQALRHAHKAVRAIHGPDGMEDEDALRTPREAAESKERGPPVYSAEKVHAHLRTPMSTDEELLLLRRLLDTMHAQSGRLKAADIALAAACRQLAAITSLVDTLLESGDEVFRCAKEVTEAIRPLLEGKSR